MDECFEEFLDEPEAYSIIPFLEKLSHVFVLKAFTKIYAMAGLRLGYALCSNEDVLTKICQVRQPWSVSGLAQRAGIAALKETEYVLKTRKLIHEQREKMEAALTELGYIVYPSQANYIFFMEKTLEGATDSLYDRMLKQGVLIRSCSNYPGLDASCYRICVKTEEENREFLHKLSQCTVTKRTDIKCTDTKHTDTVYTDANPTQAPHRPEKENKTMARSIMIQGTMSNAGKSLIAAGLCRIFAQDGYKTAPFKSQNMALNSFITEDGLEMGRAQVVQAEAAGVKPSADMNPILLKPTTDVGSQVIVNGVSIGNMRAKDYFAYKKQLIPQIMEAYKRLDEAYDVIVIEGAGSPAEINLKSDDIVNMGLAAMVDAPVLLAGDIDRGGVFAQLYGTVELLEPEERNRIKGLIINKFRGDKSILEPGLRQLEDLCKIPVAGVVPI